MILIGKSRIWLTLLITCPANQRSSNNTPCFTDRRRWGISRGRRHRYQRKYYGKMKSSGHLILNNASTILRVLSCRFLSYILSSTIHLYLTNLWRAHFVERDKDGSVQEPAEGQIRVKGPGGQQQQEELREERGQAQTKAPPAVWTSEGRIWSVFTFNTTDKKYFCVTFGLNTCTEVQHVKVRREVVPGVSSGEMVKIGLMEKLPTVPNERATGREMVWKGQLS